jgi:hypothetical protein
MAGNFTVEIEWSAGDQAFACALQRDGKPWFLGGALVGMGSTPGSAVTELTGAIRYLVIHGENYLTKTPLAFPDRAWLASLIDPLALDDEMFSALRAGGAGEDGEG